MADEKKAFSWDDEDRKPATPSTGKTFLWEDADKAPVNPEAAKPANIASETSMAAHPPAAKPLTMERLPETIPGRLNRMVTDQSKALPRTPGSDEEAVREGSAPAVAGLSAIGLAGIPGEAIATRSLAPIARAVVPLARGAIGTAAGRYIGREAGGLLTPIVPRAGEIGGEIGGVVGGLYGGMGGKLPTGWLSLMHSLAEAGAAPEAAAAVPERLPTISKEPFSLTAPTTESEAAIQSPLPFPKAEPTAAAPTTGRIKPVNAPVATESAPAAALGRIQPVGAPTSTAVAEPAEGRIAKIVDEVTGAKPLKPNVPLREQVTTAPTTETDPMKIKYPDSATRQMVRANGEAIVQKVGDDKETMKALHDLTRVDLRQALINAGEDMGQTTVSNSKFAGEGSITREDAFNRLLKRNVAPKDIVSLAKQPIGETPAAAPEDIGERRSANPKPYTGPERRYLKPLYGTPGEAKPIKLAKTPGEELEETMRNTPRAGEGAAADISEGEVMREFMKDPAAYEKLRNAEPKVRDSMLAKMKRTMAERKTEIDLTPELPTERTSPLPVQRAARDRAARIRGARLAPI